MTGPHQATHRDDEWRPGGFLPLASEDYSDIHQFFVREALLMDNHRYAEWCSVFTRDVTYSFRQSLLTACRNSFGLREFSYDYRTIVHKIARLSSDQHANGETPKIALRRFVTNLSVCFANCRAEYDVVSYLLVSQYEVDTGSTTFLTAERHDRLCRRDRSFAISRREIVYDQKVRNPLEEMILL